MSKKLYKENEGFACILQSYFPVFAAGCLSLLFSLCVVHYAFGNHTPHYTKRLYICMYGKH